MNRQKHDYFPFFLIAPTISILLFIVIFPMLYSLFLSFTNYNLSSGERSFIFLSNYKNIIFDDSFLNSMGLTATLVISSVTISFLIALGLALVLNKYAGGRAIVIPLMLMPMMLTPVVVGLMWGMMYNTDFGVIAYLLRSIGFERSSWTGDPSTALFSLMVVDVWQWTPFMMILLLSGLQGIPQEQYESAEIDGAPRWQIFRYITFPLLKTMVMVAVIFRLMDAIKIFDIVYTITRGGPGTVTEVISLYIFKTGFKFFRMGYATSLSWILLIVTIVLTQFYVKAMRK